MNHIVTLCMNPCIDKAAHIDHVVPERKLRCGIPRFYPGGGGINVSRAVGLLGGQSKALFPVGGPTGQMLLKLLEKEGVNALPTEMKAWTRENLIVYEQATGQQYRFGMPGAPMLESEWMAILNRLEDLVPVPDYLVASGSLPRGVPADFFGLVAEIAKEKGTRCILDTSGEPLKKGLEAGVYLVKPNVRELQDLSGKESMNESEQEVLAADLIAGGGTKGVVLSLGSAGAMIVEAEGCRRLRAPTMPVRSKVGAGDSMVGGIVLGLVRGYSLVEAVRFGVAAGAAAVKSEGTELCRREDADALYEYMRRKEE